MANDTLALKLRFVPPPQPASTQRVWPPNSPTALVPSVHGKLPAGGKELLPAQRATHVSALPPETGSTSKRIAPTLPDQYTNNEASADGGFQERLFRAKHSYDVHGVPGSDAHLVPGIQLADPMSQGVGAVMRKTQRLFGVMNRHCIDVDVWRQLTPRELSARHISSRQVDDVDQKYECSKPMGLSF